MLRNFSDRMRLYLHGRSNDFSIGECYQYGRYVELNLDRAKFFYHRAAKRDHAEAYVKLGEFYVEEDNIRQALKYYLYGAMRGSVTADNYLQQFALQGNATAKYYLGLVFEHREDWWKAKEWYEKALEGEEKYVVAMYRLGTLYHVDRLSPGQRVVIKKDITKELGWYKKGVEQGCAHALDALVTLAANESQASILLAQMYSVGEGCITKNSARVIDYYKQASQLGSIEADYQLGICYENMLDVQDFSKAFNSYLAAAKQKHQKSLTSLERLTDKSQNASFEYQLAEFYYVQLKNITVAAEWYKKAADRGYETAVSKLHQVALSDSTFSYLVAKLYEQHDMQKSTLYYAIAMRQEHKEGTKYLQLLVAKNNADAQYAMAYEYYHRKNNLLEAAKLCMQAEEQKHTLASNYLRNTKFNAEICLQIARMYEQGENISKNMTQALEFYKRASQLGNVDASFYLGQLYFTRNDSVLKNVPQAIIFYKIASQLGNIEANYRLGLCYENEVDEKDNFKLAFYYYFKAAQEKHEKALAALIRLAEESQNAEFEYQLAEFYYQKLEEIEVAVKWYKKAADRRYASASSKLQQLVNSDSAFAYATAQLYEKDDPQKATIYYVIAMRNGNNNAAKYLQSLVDKENADAQYAMAYEYYYRKNNLLKAAKLCMQAAEQKHTLASNYLRNTKFNAEICLQIARMYEQGENVSKNMAQAFEFYIRAQQLGNQEAIFCLGQLYQMDHHGIKKDIEKSFNYYLKAAESGNQTALITLERLGEKVDSDLQVKLGELYSSKFNDIEKAKQWYQIASDVNNSKAQRLLRELEQQGSRNGYRH